MSEPPNQPAHTADTETVDASTPIAGGPATGSGVVETVVMPVAQAAVGGVVTAAVGAVTERVMKKS